MCLSVCVSSFDVEVMVTIKNKDDDDVMSEASTKMIR